MVSTTAPANSIPKTIKTALFNNLKSSLKELMSNNSCIIFLSFKANFPSKRPNPVETNMYPSPPICNKKSITIWPKSVKYVPIFTTDKPVTQTAEVAVNKHVNTEKDDPCLIEKGKHNNIVPNNIRTVKNNIMVFTGDEFIKYFYAYAAFAISTNCLNVALSFTAISASIFLSRITFAFLRPAINLL